MKLDGKYITVIGRKGYDFYETAVALLKGKGYAVNETYEGPGRFGGGLPEVNMCYPHSKKEIEIFMRRVGYVSWDQNSIFVVECDVDELKRDTSFRQEISNSIVKRGSWADFGNGNLSLSKLIEVQMR